MKPPKLTELNMFSFQVKKYIIKMAQKFFQCVSNFYLMCWRQMLHRWEFQCVSAMCIWSPESKLHPACIKRSLASKSGEVSLTLYSAAMRAHLKNSPALGSPAQEKCGPVGQIQIRPTKLIRGLKLLSYEASLGWFNLRRRLWGEHKAAFQYLKTAYKKGGDGLFYKSM